MNTVPRIARRTFLGSALGAAALPRAVHGQQVEGAKWKIAAFAKPFQALPYEEAAGRIAAIGFDGIEPTVRNKGQVLPENVGRDLPKLAAAVEAAGLEFTCMATHVGAVDQEHTRRVLETAAGLGIKRYRMDYFRYRAKKPIKPQIDQFRRQAEELAALNAEIGIQGLYQNHAGKHLVGAGLWDLEQVLADCDPAHLGVAFDMRHARVEAGMSWPVGTRLLKPRVGMLYVKDFRWQGGKIKNVPLRKGIVGGSYYQDLAATGAPLPVSLHIEYGNLRDLEAAAGSLREDLATLRGWLDG